MKTLILVFLVTLFLSACRGVVTRDIPTAPSERGGSEILRPNTPPAPATPMIASKPVIEERGFVLNGSLQISNTNGDIVIETWDQEKILARAEVERPKNSEEKKVSIVIAFEGDPLARKGSQAQAVVNAPPEYKVQLKLKVPKYIHLEKVETGTGQIVIRGISGKVKAKTAKGHVSITQHEGPVIAESLNGKVTLGVQDFYDEVEARTTNGDIELTFAASVVLNAGFKGNAVRGTIEGKRYQQLEEREVGADRMIQGHWGYGEGRIHLFASGGNISIN